MSIIQSPLSSFGPLISSPAPDAGNSPEEEVERLVADARRVSALDDHLAAVVHGNRAAFLNIFSRQVALIKSRSQAFEDAHVTVYDKVLLLLTRNGNDLESPAGITWYCIEFLGINPFNRDGKMEQLFHYPTERLAASQVQEKLLSRESADGATLKNPLCKSGGLEPSHGREDPRFVHLWSVYSKAYADYLALADKREGGTFDAARFLRDTAENGTQFLKDNYPHDPALVELENTYNMAKNVVLSLNGGRKRKFDVDTEKAGGYKTRSPAVQTAEHTRGDFEDWRRKSIKRREKPRGRGPSGIPYGYTRPVDSYYPA